MEGGFYHWSRPAANAPKNSYEMRSTWTAVP
jgi:hypothetical protein